MVRNIILAALVTASGAFATLDFPYYFDVGCPATKPTSWYIGLEKADFTFSFNCTTPYSGSDALEMQLAAEMPSGGSYSVIMKPADESKRPLNGYQDIKMRVKNLGTAEAKLRMVFESKSGTQTSSTQISVPVGSDWQLITVPFTSFSGLSLTDTMQGMGFVYNYNYGDRPTGSAYHVLIDQILLTDGTAHTLMDVPTHGAGVLPANWPTHLVIGSIDARENNMTTAAKQAVEYRYQYIIPETFTSWSSTYVQDYATRSEEMGVKSGFVWYNLGKVSEKIDSILINLASATFMNDYATRYEMMLDQMVTAGQKDYIIVIEPDMYGVLIQQGPLKTKNCADVPVNVTMMNTKAGKTYDANLCGMTAYLVERAKTRLTKGAIIGHLLNHWATNLKAGQDRIEAHIQGGYDQAVFLNSLGTGKGDVFFVEKADRDAATKGAVWSWTQTQYTKFLAWVMCISQGSGLRAMGWQISEGNSHHPAAYLDDAVEHFLANSQQWANAGFIGILFGGGMEGQANRVTVNGAKEEDNDGGFFVSSMKTYSAAPQTIVSNLGSTPPVRAINQVSTNALVRATQGGIAYENLPANAQLQVHDLTGRLLLQQHVSGYGTVALPKASGVLLYQVKAKGLSLSGRVAVSR